MSNKSCADMQPFPGGMPSLWDDSNEKSGLIVFSHVKKKLRARTRKRQAFHASPVFYSVLILL